MLPTPPTRRPNQAQPGAPLTSAGAERQATPEEVETRRQQALAAADRCARLLRDRFGARRVIVFGSLAGESPWHADSDLDLAVEGLPPGRFWEAEEQLHSVVPSWLELDLVPLERADPRVRARILRERPMPEHPYLALRDRLEDELAGLERIAQGLEAGLQRAGAVPDEFAARALASYVDDFYKGCERICERVAVTFDGGLPQGERWHQVLLGQMGEPGGGGRPPLLGGSLLLALDEYRRFRHRIRHIYGYELDVERVLTLAQGVTPVLGQVQKAVKAFGEWLQAQAAAGEGAG